MTSAIHRLLMAMDRLTLTCGHVCGANVPFTTTVADYVPLTVHQVLGLLELSRTSKIRGIHPKVQVQLTRGIPGMECPHRIEGHVSDCSNKLSQHYCETFDRDVTPTMADAQWYMDLYREAKQGL